MQLAQEFPDVNVVGLGAQDTLDQANGFVTSTGLTGDEVTMVWDPSFDSWRSFGVRSQPYWILFDSSGEMVVSRPGAVDADAVRDAL